MLDMIGGIFTPCIISYPKLIVDLKTPQSIFYNFVADGVWSKESINYVIKRGEIN
jgi:hypothetical protein